MFRPKRKGRASKRRKTSVESDDDDDVFLNDDAAEIDVVEEGKPALAH